MTQLLYDNLAIPEACRVGKRVFKKLFHQNADLGPTDKKAFAEDIDSVLWQYTLKPGTIQVPAYEDSEREYHEIAILQVDLKTFKRTTRIAEIIHRAIPYPLVILLAYCGESKDACRVLISLAHKRFSQAEKGAIVVEEFFHTEWIDLDSPTPVQLAFLHSLTIGGLPTTHLFALYSALVDRLIALEAARLTGDFALTTAFGQREERRRLLAKCHALEGQIAELRLTLKQETQFNRQVELNTQIKQLGNDLRKLVSTL